MSTDLWRIEKHIIPAAHIRGLDRGARDANNPALRLAVNHYIPKSFPPKNTDTTNYFTIICAHGIAFSKESYEPFFDDLLSQGAPIRSLWIADSVASAESFRLNEDTIGDEVHWLDYARDIWAMINHFQAQMPPPLVGIGNSLGFGELAILSSWHPRLFSGIVAVDPALGPRPGMRWPAPYKWYPGVLATRRKDTWPSRDEAREALLKTAYYKKYDPRVFEKVMNHELRYIEPSQSTIPPSSADSARAVTLQTPKYMEAYIWLLADPPLEGNVPAPEAQNTYRIRKAAPPGFYRAEAHKMYAALPELHPPVLLAWGSQSPHAAGWNRAYFMDVVGMGAGGNGGEEKGMVHEVLVEGAGHPVAQERPKEMAMQIAPWLGRLKQKVDEASEKRRGGMPFVKDLNPTFLERVKKLSKL